MGGSDSEAEGLGRMSCATALKTHCSFGHPWTPESTHEYWRDGRLIQRVCRLCWSRRNRQAIDNRRALETPSLDLKAKGRLIDAWLDGVPERDLAKRFGITLAAVKEATKGLTRSMYPGRDL